VTNLTPPGSECNPRLEVAMLQLYGQRAELANGQNILELGCGWGSLSLWMAKTYPKSKVTGVSNSRTQKEFIMARAAERKIKNLTIITADMVTFEVGLYKLNPADPQLESAWFQPLYLPAAAATR
jgi:cyclopropane-fatty-acyl-phospholipid synthase